MRTTFITITFLFFCFLSINGEVNTETLQGIVSELVNLEKQISQEKLKWKEEELFLKEQIKFLSEQKEHLLLKVKQKENKNEELLSQINRLKEELLKYEKTKAKLDSTFKKNLTKANNLCQAVPDSLKENITPFINKFNNETLTFPERFISLITVIKGLETLSNTISLKQEILTPPNQNPKEFSVLYIGLSQAYCLSMDNQLSAYKIINSGSSDWQWDKEIAPLVKVAVDIYSQKESASFVSLPVFHNQWRQK